MTHPVAQSFHFIAIGGAAMHNLALALHQNGAVITGSDDEINEPSRSRLAAAGLLPPVIGWFPEKLHAGISAVILGMHARADNPELAAAKQLGIPVFSYPEFLYEQSKNKLRVVIGGSHGKTTITSMILHVLRVANLDFDYMVGAKLEGFDTMVKISNAPIIILEGDEYLSSPIDRRPKFHLYHANIGLISGIAWDHVNVFPTFENYVEQFKIFANQLPHTGTLIYCSEDVDVSSVANQTVSTATKRPYGVPSHRIDNGVTVLQTAVGDVPLQVFGKHNLMNLEGARAVCELLGVTAATFYEAIGSFKGAARRLELLSRNDHVAVFKDFAHSPSKLRATTEAVRQQFPNRKLIACMELHTFSSLNESFLDEYNGTLAVADIAMVYYNPHTIEHKKLPPISINRVERAFAKNGLRVYTDSTILKADLLAMNFSNAAVLLMSSGNFDGLSLEAIAQEIAEKSNVANS
jgi:UDP-N-acetylmuramate: L-alanyl-gamma-D-glutamyl-meso-diaminopimelate ligase